MPRFATDYFLLIVGRALTLIPENIVGRIPHNPARAEETAQRLADAGLGIPVLAEEAFPVSYASLMVLRALSAVSTNPLRSASLRTMSLT